jgi:hypothetical protein
MGSELLVNEDMNLNLGAKINFKKIPGNFLSLNYIIIM